MNVRPTALSPPLTDEAGDVDALWRVFAWIATGVVVLVIALVAWCVLRYRRRDDRLPRQVRHNTTFEILYTVTPLVVVVGLLAGTYATMRDLDRADDPDVVVDVTGFQWQWRFEYPASGVTVVGTTTSVPTLVLPSDSTVRFRVTSDDVIHSFWIPGFRYKRDAIPGQVQEFEAHVGSRTGTYDDGACAEYCGLDHATMRFAVRVVDRAGFDAWIASAGDEDGGT